MGDDSNAAIPVDVGANPLYATPASALASTQSSMLVSGSDYASAAKAQVPHIDALGQGYSVPTSTTGVAMPLGINAAGSSTGGFGTVPLAWDATTGTGYWRPFQVDASGMGLTRSAQYPTANWSPTVLVSTTTSSGRSMLSLYNSSATTYVHRIGSIYTCCPPQVNTTAGLLGIGSGSSYTPIFFELHRFTTLHTGGTVVTSATYDPSDTYDTGLTCRVGATISGETTPILCQWDAAYNGATSIASREDPLAKQILIPVGTGLHIKCISALSTSVAFQLRVLTLQSTS